MCNLDTDEALKIHIEGLQATLTKRNARIKELEEKLAQPVDLPEKVTKMLKKAYKDGWQDCALNFADSAKELNSHLSKLRTIAMNYYYESLTRNNLDV